MNRKFFSALMIVFGGGFALAFAVIVVPPLMASGDIFGAFRAGFVNPYSTGYSLDAIFCALILAAWILYERATTDVRHGWVAIPLCVAPGVATAFAVYLLLRLRSNPH